MFQDIHSKSGLAVILRGQPTCNNQRFARYGFSAILELLGSILDQKMGFV